MFLQHKELLIPIGELVSLFLISFFKSDGRLWKVCFLFYFFILLFFSHFFLKLEEEKLSLIKEYYINDYFTNILKVDLNYATWDWKIILLPLNWHMTLCVIIFICIFVLPLRFGVCYESIDTSRCLSVSDTCRYPTRILCVTFN